MVGHIVLKGSPITQTNTFTTSIINHYFSEKKYQQINFSSIFRKLSTPDLPRGLNSCHGSWLSYKANLLTQFLSIKACWRPKKISCVWCERTKRNLLSPHCCIFFSQPGDLGPFLPAQSDDAALTELGGSC